MGKSKAKEASSQRDEALGTKKSVKSIYSLPYSPEILYKELKKRTLEGGLCIKRPMFDGRFPWGNVVMSYGMLWVKTQDPRILVSIKSLPSELGHSAVENSFWSNPFASKISAPRTPHQSWTWRWHCPSWPRHPGELGRVKTPAVAQWTHSLDLWKKTTEDGTISKNVPRTLGLTQSHMHIANDIDDIGRYRS